MAIPDDDLDYEHHLAFYECLGHLSDDPTRDAFWHRQAEYLHALSVSDAIRDVSQDAVVLSQTVASPEANLHLRFGVSRRTKFIWLSLRRLLDLIHPEREEPLPLDSVGEAAMDLNVIYINIRGTMDNFAWCLLNLFGEEKTRALPPGAVHLFGRDFLSDRNFNEAAAFVKRFKAWNQDLKDRRDPAAHGIPLSVPPAILDGDAQKEEYAKISAEHDEAIGAAMKAVGDHANKLALLEKAGLIFERLERVGTFHPLFGHNPIEGHIKIYPTVPQDIGHLVKITRGLTAIISEKLIKARR